ncbi:MAG: sigma-70 family RNA polymerase sigma factor [Phycisphaerae bacterium]
MEEGPHNKPAAGDNQGHPDVTLLLDRLASGDENAGNALLPIVYSDLRALAGSYFRGQRADHTLQPTALVHEAFIKLVRATGGEYENRSHFLAVAATAMRQILKDHARGKATAKRGGGAERIDLDNLETPTGGRVVDAVALDDALDRLSEADERMGRIIELWFFGGMTVAEIAEHIGVSDRTVKRSWRQAKAWLNSELAVD